jgi:hypothetical protein
MSVENDADLLSEMLTDSSTDFDKMDSLREGELDAVARLATEAGVLQEEISVMEGLLKDKKKALLAITDGQLPDALEQMGLEKFTLTDGSEIATKVFYGASIPSDRRDEAYEWLRDHEFGDLVKNNVTVTFGRGEDETAKEFIELCGAQGFSPNQSEKVEPMVLKAWLRERVEAGDPIPLDLFGAYISNRATIKRSK